MKKMFYYFFKIFFIIAFIASCSVKNAVREQSKIPTNAPMPEVTPPNIGPDPVPDPDPDPDSTQTPSPTPSPTATATPIKDHAAPTNTPITPTETPTSTETPTPTSTSTNTPTEVPTKIPTEIPTDAPTQTPTYTPSSTPSSTPSPTPGIFVCGNEGIETPSCNSQTNQFGDYCWSNSTGFVQGTTTTTSFAPDGQSFQILRQGQMPNPPTCSQSGTAGKLISAKTFPQVSSLSVEVSNDHSGQCNMNDSDVNVVIRNRSDQYMNAWQIGCKMGLRNNNQISGFGTWFFNKAGSVTITNSYAIPLNVNNMVAPYQMVIRHESGTLNYSCEYYNANNLLLASNSYHFTIQNNESCYKFLIENSLPSEINYQVWTNRTLSNVVIP
ncbi:MAG: hypothetical protein QE271_01775 [Bacteriovoracaceae bacterium]|nr:hypothetical protein [Bacteriovoracaceae bacterium]